LHNRRWRFRWACGFKKHKKTRISSSICKRNIRLPPWKWGIILFISCFSLQFIKFTYLRNSDFVGWTKLIVLFYYFKEKAHLLDTILRVAETTRFKQQDEDNSIRLANWRSFKIWSSHRDTIFDSQYYW